MFLRHRQLLSLTVETDKAMAALRAVTEPDKLKAAEELALKRYVTSEMSLPQAISSVCDDIARGCLEEVET